MTTLEKTNSSEEKNICDGTRVCVECNNAECKCHQIMNNLSNSIDLANQIGHDELYNILLTVFVILQHLREHAEDLSKIEKTCQEIYKEISPKEMGITIN